MRIEARLAELGLTLPRPPVAPPGLTVRFAWAREYQGRIFLAGHGPTNTDGSLAHPLGKVGADLSPEEGYVAARLATLSLLASLKHAVGDLDRVAAWLTVKGFVNAAPGFAWTTNVMNGFSDLVLDLFGPEVGAHARAAIGAAELAAGSPVIISAEVAIRPA
jgi:hypothetical protein